MVRSYKRISRRKQWNSNDLRAAIEDVTTLGTTVNRTALNRGIPRQTLARHLKARRTQKDVCSLGRYDTVFSKQQEDELLQHVLHLEKTFYGITSTEIRSLAFQLAEQNHIEHPFNKHTELAGKDWLGGFRKRHKELSLRTPEPTSIARAHGFNRVAVDQFFDILEEQLSTGKFTADRIYNVDETSVLTVSIISIPIYLPIYPR